MSCHCPQPTTNACDFTLKEVCVRADVDENFGIIQKYLDCFCKLITELQKIELYLPPAFIEFPATGIVTDTFDFSSIVDAAEGEYTVKLYHEGQVRYNDATINENSFTVDTTAHVLTLQVPVDCNVRIEIQQQKLIGLDFSC